MPAPEVVAMTFIPSDEHVTAVQALVGAGVKVQFWPRADTAAVQRIPKAVVKRRDNPGFTRLIATVVK
jgi:hypothetical protein